MILDLTNLSGKFPGWPSNTPKHIPLVPSKYGSAFDVDEKRMPTGWVEEFKSMRVKKGQQISSIPIGVTSRTIAQLVEAGAVIRG